MLRTRVTSGAVPTADALPYVANTTHSAHSRILLALSHLAQTAIRMCLHVVSGLSRSGSVDESGAQLRLFLRGLTSTVTQLSYI